MSKVIKIASAAALAMVFVQGGVAQAGTRCTWDASIGPPLPLSDFLVLTVKGICEESEPGVKLTLSMVNVSASDPSTLTLVLDTVRPPFRNSVVIPTPTPVEYSQNIVVTQHAPTKVTVLEATATFDVVVPTTEQ
jgi:hypothetical protein